MPRTARIAVLMIMISAGCGTTPANLASITGTRESDHTVVARVLDDVHRGMETRRIYKVLAHVSPGYKDAEGRDYKAIQSYLADFFDRYREIRITRANPRLRIEGDRAQALETFGTRAEALNDGDISINVQGEVVVSLRRENGEWKITEWGELR